MVAFRWMLFRAWCASHVVRWVARSAGQTAAEASVVVDVLALAGREVGIAEAVRWTSAEREAAAEWAGRELAAAMAPPGDVVRLPVPYHVAKLPRLDVPPPRETVPASDDGGDWCSCGFTGHHLESSHTEECLAAAGRLAELESDDVRTCEGCGVDETLGDPIDSVNASGRTLCAECADEEALAVIATVERDADLARMVEEAKATGAWSDWLQECGFAGHETGNIPTACVVQRIALVLAEKHAKADDARIRRDLSQCACDDGAKWLAAEDEAGRTLAESWARCERGEWLWWAVTQMHPAVRSKVSEAVARAAFAEMPDWEPDEDVDRARSLLETMSTALRKHGTGKARHATMAADVIGCALRFWSVRGERGRAAKADAAIATAIRTHLTWDDVRGAL